MKRVVILLVVLSIICTMLMVNVFSASPKITLRMGDNLPDRKGPWGLVVEEINAQFKAKHPNVEIVTESYQDQPYQQKIQIYAASNQIPDVFKYWSFKPLLGQLAESGYVLPLNEKDFAKMGFIPGSLDSNKYGGKLYGLPVTTDFWVIFYNKALFEKNGVKVPTTLDELVAAAKTFRSNGVIPMVTDGKDSWPLCITWDNLVGRTNGDFSIIQKALDRKMKFNNPAFLAATTKFKELVDAKVFADDLLTSDYGASRNLFGQEKAAMYIMGSWESGLSTDAAFSDSFKKNVSVMKFPAGPKGSVDDLVAWFGGNYCISAKTKYKALCIDYLKTYFTLYPKLSWQHKVNVPAQIVQTTPEDNQLSKDMVSILSTAKKTSGTPIIDRSTPEFKDSFQKYIQELAAGIKTPQQFLEAVDVIADKAASQK